MIEGIEVEGIEVEGIEVEGHLLNAWCRLRDDERNVDPAAITAVRPAR